MVCNIEKKDTKINISQEKQCTVDYEWPFIAARQADVQNSPPIKGALSQDLFELFSFLIWGHISPWLAG